MAEPDRRYHRLLYTVIIVQFGIIITLVGLFSNEYLSNAYMQTWIQQNAPGAEILLNGGVVALLIGTAIGLTTLLIQNRRAPTLPIPNGTRTRSRRTDDPDQDPPVDEEKRSAKKPVPSR